VRNRGVTTDCASWCIVRFGHRHWCRARRRACGPRRGRAPGPTSALRRSSTGRTTDSSRHRRTGRISSARLRRRGPDAVADHADDGAPGRVGIGLTVCSRWPRVLPAK
jgi:hypothetical protein